MSDAKDFMSWLMPGAREKEKTEKGGEGSGFFGHAGRPGKRGGSSGQSGVSAGYGQEHTPTKFELEEADKLIAMARKGGFSYRRDKASPTTGYMVSLPRRWGHEWAMPLSLLTRERVIDYVRKKRHLVENHPNMWYGGWVNSEDGLFYLDLSTHVKDRTAAVSAGIKGEQKAIFDVVKVDEIRMSAELRRMGKIKERNDMEPRKCVFTFSSELGDEEIADEIMKVKEELISKVVPAGMTLQEWEKSKGLDNFEVGEVPEGSEDFDEETLRLIDDES